MIKQGSGVILAFGGSGDPDPMHDYLGATEHLGGTQVAYDAIEAMRRQLSAELGPHGVRAVTLRTDAVPEPDRPLRSVLGADAIADDLDRLAAEQGPDGGWDVDFEVFSSTAAVEWRGSATLRALKLLKANGRLE
jgi:3-oxoacyl-[acyl-carrier protein] reductase